MQPHRACSARTFAASSAQTSALARAPSCAAARGALARCDRRLRPAWRLGRSGRAQAPDGNADLREIAIARRAHGVTASWRLLRGGATTTPPAPMPRRRGTSAKIVIGGSRAMTMMTSGIRSKLREAHSPAGIHVLEAHVREPRHHEQTRDGRDRDAGDERREPVEALIRRRDPDHRRDTGGGRGAREALEEPPILRDVAVEARQAKRRCRHVQERREPARAGPRSHARARPSARRCSSNSTAH